MAHESAVVRAARAGDADALGALYRTHGGRLLRLCAGLLGTRVDAEDVVHDVFVALPEALGRYREDGRFDAWLTRITVRTALMRLRATRRRREVPEVDVAGRDEEDRQAAHRTVESLLVRLPEDQRAVVVLKAIEGWSHADIGRTLGIRANTSEVRYCRALKALRGMMRNG